MAKKQSLILLFLTLLLGAGCRDPIFYKISREVKPREPRIKGVPTKFVVYNADGDDYMYVAAASLHRYRDGGWDQGVWAKPPGTVFDLASSEDYLYALTNPERPAVWRWKAGMTEWEQLGGYSGSLQSIYGETDADGKPISKGKVFVGVRQGDPTEDGIDYAIYYVDEAASVDSALKPVPLPLGEKTGRLTGAAYDGAHHFLSTFGRGLYSWDETSTVHQLGNSANPKDTNRNLVGIIWTGAKVFAFGRRTDIYEVGAGGFTIKRNTASYYLTDAAAIWKLDNTATKGKILLGVKDGSNYGYEEIEFDLSTQDIIPNSAGMIDLYKPSNNVPSSVTDEALFDTTLRPHPVNHIFQTPESVDPARVLFAAVQGTGSTTNDIDSGVWSYRNRDGKDQWNAEE
jgi:hypothetical protein